MVDDPCQHGLAHRLHYLGRQFQIRGIVGRRCHRRIRSRGRAKADVRLESLTYTPAAVVIFCH